MRSAPSLAAWQIQSDRGKLSVRPSPGHFLHCLTRARGHRPCLLCPRRKIREPPTFADAALSLGQKCGCGGPDAEQRSSPCRMPGKLSHTPGSVCACKYFIIPDDENSTLQFSQSHKQLVAAVSALGGSVSAGRVGVCFPARRSRR